MEFKRSNSKKETPARGSQDFVRKEVIHDLKKVQSQVQDSSVRDDMAEGQQIQNGKGLLHRFKNLASEQQFQTILSKAIPCSLQQFVWFLTRVTQISVVGYYGDENQIAGMSLGFSFMSVFGWSLLIGYSGALDTYCSQAYTGNRKMTGVYLQRFWVLMVFICIPIGFGFFHSAPILNFFGQDPNVTFYSQQYSRIMIADLLPSIIFIGLEKYAQAQGIFTPILLIELCMLPVFAIMQYICVFIFFGFRGAATGVVICDYIQTTIFCIYVAYFQGYEAWDGFSKLAFKDLGQFIMVGTSSLVQICSEWWAVEIQTIFCGWISVTALASQIVIYSTATLLWCLYFGVQVAGGVSVGNYMGSGKVKEAKQAVRYAVLINFGMAILVAVFLIAFRDIWVKIYTNEPSVREMAKTVIPVQAIGGIFDAVQGTSGGLLRGLGRQYVGAFINTITYYVLSVPLSLALAFWANMGLQGIWLSLGIAFLIQAVVLLTYLNKVDYEKAVKEAYDRVVSGRDQEQESTSNKSDNLKEPLLQTDQESSEAKV